MPKVIDIDSSKPPTRTPFSRLTMLPGKTLVERSFPMSISAGPYTLIKHMEMTDKLKSRVINNVDTWSEMPLRRDVTMAIKMMVTMIDDIEIRLKAFVDFKHYGIISWPSLVALQRAYHAQEVVKAIVEMKKWLNDESDELTCQFREELGYALDTLCPLNHTFSPHSLKGASVAMQKVLKFRNTEWLDGELIDALLRIMHSRHQDRQASKPCMYSIMSTNETEGLHSGKLTDGSVQAEIVKLSSYMEKNPMHDVKLFGVILTEHNSHWNVIAIDFASKKVLLGDSLDGGHFQEARYPNILQGAFAHLTACGVATNDWTSSRFPVEQQGDGGSCGIAAVNAIECFLEPGAEVFLSTRTKYFRLKYAMYITSMGEAVSAFCHDSGSGQGTKIFS
ncbi:hypothetical protein BGZ81_003510 [Podila clonocystis]|nr:hypothetical protein BGZ81_003510 [Podila clonocystis]